MIQNIRKYNGLIVLSLVVVAFALVLGLQDTMRSGMGGQAYLKIAGRTYSDQEYRKLGINALDLIRTLTRSGDFEMYQFIYSLSPEAIYPGAKDDATEKFFISRMLIRNAKSELGVLPGDDEISEYTRQMKSFSTPEQKFDPETYARFIEKGLGSMGMTEKDFRELISDVIAADKIRQIIGNGLATNRDAVEGQFALSNQKIDGALGLLDLETFKSGIKPTDEELKAYWELIQDAFKTETERKFTYILVAPDMPAAEPADKKEAKPSLAEAAMTDEAKAKAEQAKAEKEAKLAEVRRERQRQLDGLVDDFTYALEEGNGAGFEDLAAANKWEVKTTELFTPGNPPAELNLKLRSSSMEGSAVDELFKIKPTADPLSKISQPIAVGENQWLVARLDGEVEPRTKTFDEAKTEVLAKYVAEKAGETLKKAADEASAKIKQAIADGKDFQSAAKDAGLKEIKAFTQIDSSYRPSPLTEPANLYRASSTVDPGSIAEPILQGSTAFIVHVSKRTLVKETEHESRLASEIEMAANSNLMSAFGDWISVQTEMANVERYYRQ